MPAPVSIAIPDHDHVVIAFDADGHTDDACDRAEAALIPTPLTQEEIDHVFARRVANLKSADEVMVDNSVSRSECFDHTIAAHLVRLIDPLASSEVREKETADYLEFRADLDRSID